MSPLLLLLLQVTASPTQRHLTQATDNQKADFTAASSCKALPTATTSTPDSSGHLWGCINNQCVSLMLWRHTNNDRVFVCVKTPMA